MTAFALFGLLDKYLFAQKLQGMVYLTWKTMEKFSPGMTSAAGQKAPRINIQLNKTPFMLEEGTMDNMLEIFIQQMIHAYFLVCCDSQKHDEKQDGRLLDGLHFGLLLETIIDITGSCKFGPLNMIFHASRRTLRSEPPTPRFSRSFIAFDPSETSFDAGTVTGNSCCHQDNRHVRYAEIKHWQVEVYARHLNENMESRGDHVLFFKKGKGLKTPRPWGPPSWQYSELICTKQNIAISK